MKKFILLGLGVAMFANANALSYRGFVDFEAGICTNKITYYESPDIYNATPEGFPGFKSNMAFGVTTSHGVQLNPSFFVGLGTGVFTSFVKSDYKNVDGSSSSAYDGEANAIKGLNIPLFLNGRWELDIRKKATPYVDLKIGYQFIANISGYSQIRVCPIPNAQTLGSAYVPGIQYDPYYLNGWVDCNPTGGFFLLPSVGYRFKITKKSGFNIGMSYLVSIPYRIDLETRLIGDAYQNHNVLAETKSKINSMHTGVLMLNFGFDF